MLKKKKIEDYIYYGLGVFLIVSIPILLISIISSNEKYLSSENITVVSNTQESKNEFEKVDKIEVKTVGIAVDSYSFDGGLNWQKSNEYYATGSEKLIIIVRDTNGKESEPMEYKVNNIDSIPPVISVKLPKQISLNSKINLGEYVSVSDDNSGVDGSIIMVPDSLDTSKVGTKTLKFSAKDKAGNEVSISVSIDVVDNTVVEKPSEDEKVKKVLYRYRVKNIIEYECNSYDCGYYENSDVNIVSDYVDTGKCDNSLNRKIKFSNGCYITPKPMDVYCTMALVTVDRYSTYGENNQYKIDIYALNKDGSQYGTNSKVEESKDDKTNCKNGTCELESYNPSNTYKQEPCGENEISIYGYCHPICSKLSNSCPSGYEMIDGKCKKYVKKTCFDKCSKSTWSDWTEWSESVVSSSDFVQVETKVINE